MYALGIEAFLAVVRTQNITQAAKMLNLAQSTTSKRLKMLEQELGTALFERGKGWKSIRLTPAGEEFVDMAEQWNSLWQETQLLMQGKPKLALSIGTLDSIINSIFPALYFALSQHEPKLSLKIITSHSPALYEDVERRNVDVAFSLLDRTHPNVIVEKCYTEPMVVLRPAISYQTEAGFIHPTELNPEDELHVSWNPGYQLWHDHWWLTASPGQTKVDTVQLILAMLKKTEQWSIVPLSVAKAARSKGIFSIFYLTEPPPERICYILKHKYPKSSTVQALKIFDHYLKLLVQKEFANTSTIEIL
ncbi:MAG: benM 1 [Firmicutes bacterium]|nr:benM 1 [Bacillota bacterium]